MLSIFTDRIPILTPIIIDAAKARADFDWSAVLSGIIAGVVAGVVVVTLQVLGDYLLHLYIKWKESRARLLVTYPHDRRYIDGRIFEQLKPGRSVEYMKNALGASGLTSKEMEPVFFTDIFLDEKYEPMTFRSKKAQQAYSDEFHSTTAYVYRFENAVVKITSKDGEVIDSLAVEFIGEETGLHVPQLLLGWSEEELILGKTTISKNLVEECQKFNHESSRQEDIVTVLFSTGPPIYTYYSYFGIPDWDKGRPETENPETFTGGTITGVCLHSEIHRCYIVRYYDYD